jgi:sulfite exporter TauE/SafE
MSNIDIISIISIAFLGSFGHCIGMCGGIVIAYTSTKIDNTFSKTRQVFSHFSYNIGRVFTYVLLGSIFGFLGGVLTLNHIANGILYIISGILMVLVGLSLIGKIRFLTSIEYSIGKSKLYKEAFQKLLKDKSYISFFYLGILNGFIPCGFVYFFAISAASSGSVLSGAIIMLIFGLSTILALFMVGMIVGFQRDMKYRDIFQKISAILVIAYGLYTIYNGYIFIIDDSSSLLNCHTK